MCGFGGCFFVRLAVVWCVYYLFVVIVVVVVVVVVVVAATIAAAAFNGVSSSGVAGVGTDVVEPHISSPGKAGRIAGG